MRSGKKPRGSNEKYHMQKRIRFDCTVRKKRKLREFKGTGAYWILKRRTG